MRSATGGSVGGAGCSDVGFAGAGGSPAAAQTPDVMRFPAPEFQSGYDFPRTTTPAPTAELQEWTDVGIFFLALCLATYFAVRKR